MHKEQTQFYERRVNKFKLWLQDKYILEKKNFDIKVATLDERFYDFNNISKFNYKKANISDVWGEAWQTSIFHIEITTPKNWHEKNLALHIDIGAEALLLDDKGDGVYAFTHGTAWEVNYKKDYFPIINKVQDGEKLSFYLEAAANGLFGIDVDEDPDLSSEERFGNYSPKINYLELVTIEPKMRDFYFDFELLEEQMTALPEGDVRRAKILNALNKCIDVYNDDVNNVSKAIDILKPFLMHKATSTALTAYSIGHAHIDTGWLWPVEESIRKIHRTFASQMTLMDIYPEYKFGASQAQHYEFLEEYYPNVFNKIQKYIDSGNWEIQGGMWVEADCNLSSGEAMIRQFLYGKNYFKKKFNQDIKNLWLPDVFGYAASMPQILKVCGVDHFQTQKISWSQFNKFPFHTFYWEGIDGSKVLTHFNPTDTYNGSMQPQELIEGAKRYTQKGYLDSFLSVYGIGDGGGGASFPHIERALRQQDLEGSPKVKFSYASEFFDDIEKENKSDLPKWVGELYLELHRGTLTSQGKVKKENRQLEILLPQLEKIYSRYSYEDYPQDTLDASWKKVLINQFHDILPGSSINEVYKVTHREYKECFDNIENLLSLYAEKFLKAKENTLTLINTESQNHNRYLVLDNSYNNCNFYDENNNLVPSISYNNETLLFANLAPFEAKSFYLKEDKNTLEGIQTENGFILENDLVKYEFNSIGEVISTQDKQLNKSFLNKGNEFSLYIDRPVDWDAWDIDPFYENQESQKAKLIDAKLYRSNEINIAELKLKIGNSVINQTIRLANNTKRLDFDTNVYWDESHKMLRVGFDTQIFNNKASFDIQYGYIERNTHRNTSWDVAKYEVVGHRYADLSDYNNGVALLNDCKYGYKVLNNLIELNLLRAPTFPDPDCDKKQWHHFNYSLYPHDKDLRGSDVITESRQLNIQPLTFKDYVINSLNENICKLESSENATIEVIKKAENENAWIVRIVETKGIGCVDNLILNKDMQIHNVNAIEWEPNLINDNISNLKIELKPFEIKTFKLI